MSKEMTKSASVAAKQQDDVVLMYPSNQLKKQEREFEETLTAFSVVKKTFFCNAAAE